MAMRRESNQRMADFAVADVSLFWLLNALNFRRAGAERFPACTLPGRPPPNWSGGSWRLASALLTFSLEHNVSAVPPWRPFCNQPLSTVFPPCFPAQRAAGSASLPSRVIALDLASLPGNRWKADLHDPAACGKADFTLSVRSSLPAHQVLHQLPLVCPKSVRLMTSRCLSTWR